MLRWTGSYNFYFSSLHFFLVLMGLHDLQLLVVLDETFGKGALKQGLLVEYKGVSCRIMQ